MVSVKETEVRVSGSRRGREKGRKREGKGGREIVRVCVRERESEKE